jgi:hypothetical protein
MRTVEKNLLRDSGKKKENLKRWHFHRKPRWTPFKESSAKTTETMCSRYVMWATWSMRLPVLHTLFLRSQHQQAAVFTRTSVMAKVRWKCGLCVPQSNFLMSTKKTDIWGYSVAIQSKYAGWVKASIKFWGKQNQSFFSKIGKFNFS